MADALGAWENAPLAYVLAEVKTELLADIKEYQPKIAGRLREEYPIQRAVHSTRLVASGAKMTVESEQDAAWECASPHNRVAVILRASGLVFHATDYRGSDDFLACLDKVVRIFAEEVKSVYVGRVGLRYVDFILPKVGESPETYVNPRLHLDLGLSPGNGPTATCVSLYPMPTGQLTLRYVRAQGDPKLPPDLTTTTLAPAPIAVVRGNPDQFTAVLDTDRTIAFSPVERLDPSKIQGIFAEMRTDLRAAFRMATTDHARKVWGAP
jgi:uncharacterized protein (TIGR04255 family)